jgi:hypothetical protein
MDIILTTTEVLTKTRKTRKSRRLSLKTTIEVNNSKIKVNRIIAKAKVVLELKMTNKTISQIQ